MIGAVELWGRSQPAQTPTLSTMPPTRPATERIRNLESNDALRPRSIFVFFFCFALLTTTVRAAPLRETPSDEMLPLSMQDGHYPYSVGNSTTLKEISKQAFYSLEESQALEPISPTLVLINDNSRRRKNKNKPGKGRQKMNGPSEILKYYGDPTKLKHVQKCEGQAFRQRVKVPGCLTKGIVNKFCHGVCSSFFIPRLKPKLKAYFKSCAFCGPQEYDHVDVTVDCPGQDPPQQTVRITKVKKCACITHDFNV